MSSYLVLMQAAVIYSEQFKKLLKFVIFILSTFAADFTKVNANHARNRSKRNWSRWLPTTQKHIRTGFAVQRNSAFRFVVVFPQQIEDFG